MEFTEQTATFTINMVGKHSKDTYMGTFKVKCLLSPMEMIAADRRYRDLLGANSHLAQESVRQQAFALAELEQRVIDMPPFWENDSLPGGHVKDANVLLHILDQAVEAQEKYIELKEKELKDRQDRLTKKIKTKKIEREPEIEEVNHKQADDPDEVDIE